MTDKKYRKMRIGDIMPNFRISSGCVEIPANYVNMYQSKMPKELTDIITVKIKELVKVFGGRSIIVDELHLEQNHRATTMGCRVPLGVWDRICDNEVEGWAWTHDTAGRTD